MASRRTVRRVIVLGSFLLGATLAWLRPWEWRREPLRIGINAWPSYEFLHLAQVEGLLAREGAEVELVEFSSLSDARRAFERGQIDGLASTVSDMTLSRSLASRRMQAILVLDESRGGDEIVACGPQEMAQLRGRRIGLEMGSVSAYVLARALELSGVPIDSVTLRNGDQGSLGAQLARGDLDAVVSYVPFSRQLAARPGCRSLFDTRAIPGEVVDVLAFEQGVVRDRADELRAVVRAWWKALRLREADSLRCDSIMAAREGISGAEFRTAFHQGMRMVPQAQQHGLLVPGGGLERVLEGSVRAMVAMGMLERGGRTWGAATPALVGDAP